MKKENEPRLKKPPKGATDIEAAMFFFRRIERPCEIEVAPGVTKDLRGYYIREARRVMKTFTNRNARVFLRGKIRQYEK